MLDTPVQTATAPGAGLRRSNQPLNAEDSKERDKHKLHYVFSPGQKIGLADRRLSAVEIPRARITLIEDHGYLIRNQTDEYVFKGEGPDSIIEVKSALDSAEEIVTAHSRDGEKRADILKSITDAEPEFVEQLEATIVPDLPSTLKKLVSYLRTKSRDNITNSGLSEKDKELAEKLRAEMQKIAEHVSRVYQNYLNRTERELINSRKSNGHGKASLDDYDRHLYGQLERKVPLEAELDFVAESETAAEEKTGESMSQGPLAEALKMIAEKLGTPAPAPVPVSQDPEFIEMKEKFSTLLGMIESGELVPAKKKASTKSE